MLKNLLILTTALFVSSGFAAEKKQDGKTVTLAIDTSTSTIQWVGSKKLGEKHTGHIKLKDGKIEMKNDKLVGGAFTFDMTSITNEDLKEKPEDQAKLVNHLKSDDFFKVDKNPTSEFKITSVKEKDGNPWIKGNLTLLGKTEAIEFPAKVENKNGVVTGAAKVEVDRTKWGLVYGSGNIFKELTANKIINNTFELNLNLIAKK